MARFVAIYWTAAAIALGLAGWGGPVTAAAVPALVLALPWNVALGAVGTLGLILVSLLLEATGMGRVNLASLSGERQAAIFLYATTPVGVLVNTALARRWRRPPPPAPEPAGPAGGHPAPASRPTGGPG